MAAVELSCRRSELTLEQPFHNARSSWHTRSILELRVRDASGLEGNGEAAPLPGYSADDVAGCQRALLAISAAQLEHLAACPGASEVLAAAAATLPPSLPAARFALETAFLDLIGKRRQLPLWRLLGELPLAAPAQAPLQLCAVLPHGDALVALRAAEDLFQGGVRVFKLKIGPDRLHIAQQQTLELLRTELGDAVTLRLDANRSLDRAALAETLSSLACYRPEFVEEPLLEPSLEELADLPVAFALDESLQRMAVDAVESVLALPTCRAVVLKPTLLGGFDRCLALAHRAHARARAAIVSHTLEGRVGFAACVQLALACQRGAAAGLWPLPHQQTAATALTSGCLPAPAASGLGASV